MDDSKAAESLESLPRQRWGCSWKQNSLNFPWILQAANPIREGGQQVFLLLESSGGRIVHTLQLW